MAARDQGGVTRRREGRFARPASLPSSRMASKVPRTLAQRTFKQGYALGVVVAKHHPKTVRLLFPSLLRPAPPLSALPSSFFVRFRLDLGSLNYY